MEIFIELLQSAEFWFAVSLLAGVLPGPQTRILPGLFRAIGQVMSKKPFSKDEKGKEKSREKGEEKTVDPKASEKESRL